MAGMGYEEKEINLGAGDGALFYSDGLVEAHNPKARCSAFPDCRRWWLNTLGECWWTS